MNSLVKNFIDSLLTEDNRFPINDLDKNIDSPNHFLKQKTISFSDVLNDMGLAQKINFFPSEIKGRCHSIAMFVSFKSPPLKFKMPKSNLIPIDTVIKKMIQQVLGSCFEKNRDIILITDEINTEKIEEWKPNLRAIQKISNSFEIIFLHGDGEYENINRFFGLK